MLQWALIVTVLVGVAVVFNPSGRSRIQPSFRTENQVWMLRLKLFLLKRNEAMRAALKDIAVLTTSFFADVDLVASDILAGLLLLVHAPHRPPSSTTYVPEIEPPEWMTLENARYMAKYIAAIYGWEIYMFYNCGCCDWLKVCKKIKCCGKCCSRQNFPVRGDNCCACSTATFLAVTECKETDIIFVSFANELYQVPFIVLVDVKAKSIVITIRGTASMMDAINDLSLDDEAFSIDVDQDPILSRDEKLDTHDKEVRVHRGMLRSARYVLEVLRANRTLEGLKMRYPDFTVVCCGHSLGAGVATLLTLLLKQSFSPIRCFAYSPPGCVISENGLKETQKFVFSVYIGDDIVPRLSFQTLCKLKYDVIMSLACSNLPKYKVLLRGFYRLCFSPPWQPDRDIGVAVVFNPSGRSRIQPSFRTENQVWMLRLKLFLLKRNEAMRAALKDIAVLTTSFFADVDLVASDILAGLLLLVHAPHRPPSSTTYVPEIEVLFQYCPSI
ncbi:lipase [Wuchereria bancrofti]|uniref:sn-1-specific diacylglycerol lipase n=1 Tax=Wuchereria bancrofti TaxID=6293 RepID=J9AXG0_WUCBA|nr:lipase [Wuchereria bancrofti]